MTKRNENYTISTERRALMLPIRCRMVTCPVAVVVAVVSLTCPVDSLAVAVAGCISGVVSQAVVVEEVEVHIT
jgi:hypothetical protein